jgi:branched-chain amino acid transport system substrate-binding protein
MRAWFQEGGTTMKHRKSLLTTLWLALATSCAASAAAAETKGPVTDDIGVLVIPKGAPIQIGGYWVMSGADSALGIDEKRGVMFGSRLRGVSPRSCG